jgi:hypothetical protein
MKTPPEILKQWYEEQDVRSIAKFLFPSSLCAQNMTPTQEEVIRDIVYHKERLTGQGYIGVDCCMMTQYGKTDLFAVAYCILMLFNDDLKIVIIAAEWDKSDPIRNFIVSNIYDCPLLLNLADIEKGGRERMKKEASRKRITFKHGGEFRFYSAHGDAQRLMGHGLTKNAGVIHIEEAAEIKRGAFAKIWRFLTGKLKKATFNQTYNPWDRDTVAYDNSIDPKFKHYQVGWKKALEEGRTTMDEIEILREKITPLEFQVLYDSEFPDESEDQLIPLSAITRSQNNNFPFVKELAFIEAVKTYTRFSSCDPADQGLDWTVIAWGIRKENQLKYLDFHAMPKSSGPQVVGKIMERVINFIGKNVPAKVNIDAVGIGSRDLQNLKVELREGEYSNVGTTACKNGEQAIKNKEFYNKKAENYFGLRDKMIEGMIDLPRNLRTGQTHLCMPNGKTKQGSPSPSHKLKYRELLMHYIKSLLLI